MSHLSPSSGRSTPTRHIAVLAVMTALAAAAVYAAYLVTPARAATQLFPDLRTLPPTELRMETVVSAGVARKVLRFSNTVWNAGQGPLELVSSIGTSAGVKQRVYDDTGAYAEFAVGDNFTFHESHNHWHFDDFATYELWTKADYDAWVASGRSRGQAQRVGTKTTFCLMDTSRVQALVGTPSSAVYSACGRETQGISVGWGDTYRYSLPDQWIDLGDAFLPNGTYVLRTVADPKNRIYESPSRGDVTRESSEANEGVTVFSVKNGRVHIAKTR
jgi:hypothetical protein